MNLDKASASLTTAPLAPADWSMDVTREGNHFTAEVRRAGVVMCRVVSAKAEPSDESAARAEMADKARIWIHEYLAREGGT